jgi:hypothetical protein
MADNPNLKGKPLSDFDAVIQSTNLFDDICAIRSAVDGVYKALAAVKDDLEAIGRRLDAASDDAWLLFLWEVSHGFPPRKVNANDTHPPQDRHLSPRATSQ